MEALSSSEVLVLTYQTIHCHTSADNNLNLYCLKNLKFCIIFLLQIDYGHPSQPNFPRSTGNWWFHCNEEGVKENETLSTPSTSTVVTDTTVISTTGEETVTNATSNLTTRITTTDSNITVTDEDVTSPIPSTSTVGTDTTAISTTGEETVTNATSNLTTRITTTDSNVTGTDKDVTSTIQTTSTTEETPPPAGSELDYYNDYITDTGIHWNWYRVVLKCDMLKEWMLLLARVFWNVRPSSVLVRYWYLQWTCCLPLPDWSWYGTKFHVPNCNTHTLRT